MCLNHPEKRSVRACAKSLQSCPTLSDPMDCIPPGSSVHEILQVGILEWVAMPSSRGSSQPRDRTQVSSIAGSSVQSLSCVRIFAAPWTRGMPGLPVNHQLPGIIQTQVHWVVMISNHLILCCPLLLLPSIFPSIRVSSYESVLHIRWPKYWSFSFSTSPSNEHSGLISCVSGHPKCQSVPLDWYWEFFGIIH